MRVHDGDHVRTRLVDFAMDVAFGEERASTVLIDRMAIEIEFQDVVGGDQFGRARA